MIDRLFLATFTFSLLAGATLAMGSDLLAPIFTSARTPAVAIVRLDPVVVTGHRPTVLAATERRETHGAQ